MTEKTASLSFRAEPPGVASVADMPQAVKFDVFITAEGFSP
jgi:hypothetical protein